MHFLIGSAQFVHILTPMHKIATYPVISFKGRPNLIQSYGNYSNFMNHFLGNYLTYLLKFGIYIYWTMVRFTVCIPLCSGRSSR